MQKHFTSRSNRTKIYIRAYWNWYLVCLFWDSATF